MAAVRGRADDDRIAGEQAALRRVATLVARAAPPAEVFAAVTEEAGRLLYVGHATMGRYDPDGKVTVVAEWDSGGPAFPVGSRWSIGGPDIPTVALQTGRPARIDDHTGISGPINEAVRGFGVRAAVGVPVSVEGRLWGVMVVGSRAEPLPAGTEARLAGFAELAATAIANAQARVELRGFAEEQAALRRVATLVAQGAPPEEVLTSVTEEAGRLLHSDYATMNRYDQDGTIRVVATWSSAGPGFPVGGQQRLGGRNLQTMIFQTRRAARIDDYAGASGTFADVARESGLRAGVGVPVSVEGRLWGVMLVGSRAEPLPAGTEARLAGFTELAATAIANAEAQAALTASRARIVATADATRRRIERNLHDGAQQRLVSVALDLRAAEATAPPGAGDHIRQLDEVAAGLDGVLDDLREIARGLHPAILADGGLPPALRTLARRSAIPVDLDIHLGRRLPEPVETAAYYTVAEALTNIAKHAHASAAELEAAEVEGVLRVRVHDNGRGGASFGHGSGLVGLRDRAEALGGRLQLHSPPGEGATLEITLPLDNPAQPEQPVAKMAALPSRTGDSRFAGEQAALRRVATLVARAAPPAEVFAAVTEEAGRLLGADYATMARYEPDGENIVAAWSSTGAAFPVGTRARLGGRNVPTLVFQTHGAARIDDYSSASGPIADAVREFGFRAAVGVPVSVEGRLWGAMMVASRAGPPPAGSEAHLAGFTELAATAIANAQARVELRGFAEEQAALRRVATLVAQGAPPAQVLTAITEEVGRLLHTDYATMHRYDPDGTTSVVATWSSTGAAAFPVGASAKLGGQNVATLVSQTHRPARIDDMAGASGPITELARELGFRAAVGVPVSVEGRLWGLMAVLSRADPLPAGTEARLARFTELAATAIANAEAQAALTASRARIVATADATRRRIERDLHDGAQQRLVSLTLDLRAAQAALAAGTGGVAQQLDYVAAGMDGVLADLREIARGLHPAILADGGLRPALKTLARRSAVPVHLDIQVQGRLPEPVETAAYYTVAEALTNAAKHAHASAADIEAAESDDVLHLRVRDDGRGGADFSHGSGLVGLKDRTEALGGRLRLHSPPGAGTTLEITLPLRAPGEPRPRSEVADTQTGS